MIYDTFNNAWLGLVKKILRNGSPITSRDGDCLEMLNVSFTLLVPEASWLSVSARKLSRAYAAAEVMWYASGSNKIRDIAAYAPSYTRFAEPSDPSIANGAYGDRLFRYNQFSRVLRLLKSSPNTRQAIISLWSGHDLKKAMDRSSPDIPCTICLQFLLRHNQLNCIAYMRSNDLYLGMPYDVFAFTYFQRMIATTLGCELGWYSHHVGSLHLYDRNREKIQHAETAKTLPTLSVGSYHDMLEAADVWQRLPHGHLREGAMTYAEQTLSGMELQFIRECYKKW